MHTKQETREVVLLNILLNNDEVTIEELKNGMIFAGVLEPTDESMINFIRASLISLARRFKKWKITLFTGLDPQIFKKTYTATEEAKNFCLYNLLEKMYDEEGEEIGFVYQHPISLNKERLELV